MNNNVNVNEAWAFLEQQLKENQKASAQKLSNSSSGSKKAPGKETDPFNSYLNARYGLNNMHAPPAEEEAKIAKYVKDVYFSMFPEKDGEVYPINWIDPVRHAFKQIRKERAKLLKTKEQNSMKGLKMHVIIGVILRCLLYKENIHLPLPIFIWYLNEGLKRSLLKKERQPVTIELFERYRLDAKKGIRTSVKKLMPQCYADVPAENLIQFTMFSIMRFDRQVVQKTRQLAREATQLFPDSTSPSTIAIGCMYMVAQLTDKKVNIKQFGLTKQKLISTANVILGSQTLRIQNIIRNLDKRKSASILI